MIKCLLAFLCIPLMVQCSALDVMNAVTPTQSIQSRSTHSYGEADRQSLDVYMPLAAKEGAPILVFVYGGGWTDGAKKDYKFAAEAFTSDGYQVVVPDYRLYPEVTYPAFIQDVAKAVAWTVNAYPGRPIVLVGHSAGAYNAIMLGLSNAYLEEQGVDRCQTVSAVAALSGPYGLKPFTEEPYISIFPDRLTADDAPLNAVDGSAPPILLMTGLDDKTVNSENSVKLAEKLRLSGNDVSLMTYPGLSHIDIVRLLAALFDEDASVRADLLSFLETRTGKAAPFCDVAAD